MKGRYLQMAKKLTKEEKKKQLEFYKKITLQYMMKYIDENAPEDKDWFKGVAMTENEDGEMVYNHLVAKKEFCKKYMPDAIPEKTVKKTKADILNEWK
jgi:hypothetical protein